MTKQLPPAIVEGMAYELIEQAICPRCKGTGTEWSHGYETREGYVEIDEPSACGWCEDRRRVLASMTNPRAGE